MLRSLLSPVAPPLCVSCSAQAGAAEPICGGCREELRGLSHDLASACGVEVWAPLAYDGPARALARALKFGRIARLAETMAAQIAATAPERVLAGHPPPALVPVPLHPARLRKRGFNQAERLAAALAARTGLALADCLERSGGGTTQVGRTRTERLQGIAGSVRLRPGCAAPARALLVDDVVTTGATLAACAAVLRGAGTAAVTGVAYARTPGR
jgi:ComF family protein